jgi:large subunit ribosomal protein L27
MAQKKGQGTSKNNRDSLSKKLGVKVFSNTKVCSGYILVRQRGYKFKPGLNVYSGKDFTLHSKKRGVVF